jgi:hypothetical protein
MRNLRIASFLALALAGLGACKQGRGDRCQISDDCGDGLVCSTGADHVCTDSASANLPDASTAVGSDAPFIVDAAFRFDAAPAAPDAAPAAPDAAPAVPDAAPSGDIDAPSSKPRR